MDDENIWKNNLAIKMTALSVNVNKFALVRNARGADLPNLIDISNKCLNYGADGITVHPRPDERHAKFSDLEPLKNLLSKLKSLRNNFIQSSNKTRSILELYTFLNKCLLK